MLINDVLFLEKSYKRIQHRCAQALGRINTHCSHLKTHFLSRNLYQSMLENALFFGKNLKKSPQRWRLCPQTPVGLRRLGTSPPDPQVVTLTQLTFERITYFWALMLRFLAIVKTTTYRFLRWFGGFVCSHENMFCKKGRQILS